MLRIGLIASLFVVSGQSQASVILKTWEINADLSEYTIGSSTSEKIVLTASF